MGFPIRKSTDQRVFAPPRSLSQRITSFIACACQGIHQLPLRHLIVLIADAHLPVPEGTRVKPDPVRDRGLMVSAQKDQLLEIGPGVRLGKPIICGRLSVSPRQTTALRPWSLNKSSLYDVKQNRQQTEVRCEPCMRMTRYPLNTRNGGAGRDRTDDILLAKQALSQLS